MVMKGVEIDIMFLKTNTSADVAVGVSKVIFA